MPPYTINCHQPRARHESSEEKSPCHMPTVASQLTDEESVSTRHAFRQPPPRTRPISLNDSLHSVSPNLLDYGLPVHTNMDSKCISKLARLWPPSVSLNSLNYRFQVHFQARLIMASECISEFTRSSFSGPP